MIAGNLVQNTSNVALYLSASVEDTTVTNNRLIDATHAIHAFSGGLDNLTISNNSIRGFGRAIYVTSGTANSVIVIGNHIRQDRLENTTNPQNQRVIDLTSSGGGEGWVISNNLFADATGPALFVEDGPYSDVIVNNNVFDNVASDEQSTHHDAVIDFDSSPASGSDNWIIQGNIVKGLADGVSDSKTFVDKRDTTSSNIRLIGNSDADNSVDTWLTGNEDDLIFNIGDFF